MKLRKRRREGTRFQEENARSDPESEYLTKELAAKVLQGLQPSLVDMFTRHKAEGWTQRELERELGVIVAAVKSRIFHARARIPRNYRLCVEYSFPA